MKKSMSFALPLALSGMLALPALASAEGEATASEPLAGGASTGQATPGFYWCHAQQTYRAIGDNKTWVYLEGCAIQGWWWCNDNECEKILIAAASSAHWIGINIYNTAGNWNYMRLWKN